MNTPRISTILTSDSPRHTCRLKRDWTGNPGEDQASTIAPTCYQILPQTRLVAQNTWPTRREIRFFRCPLANTGQIALLHCHPNGSKTTPNAPSSPCHLSNLRLLENCFQTGKSLSPPSRALTILGLVPYSEATANRCKDF